ncbi:uncharacterized protein [Nicotiana tomentosiformis]|uniref:uncharacterized protein n=1 Tax=Nicotiana tomentosiformis TaxID=4098 RepID=UPI00388C73EB
MRACVKIFMLDNREIPRAGLGKDAVMSPPSGEEKTLAPVPKLAKDNKRKRASASEDTELKKRMTRKPRKNIIPLTEEYVQRLRDEDEEEENDGSVLVARVKKIIDAPKAAGSMAVDEAPPRTEGISEKDSGKVPESLEIEVASHRSEQTVGIYEGTGIEALRTEENAPSDSLGAIVIEDSPTLPTFSEGAIREARDLGTLEVDGAHEGEDPFHNLFTGIEDAAGPSDASGLFFKAQRALNRALALHQEVFSKSRGELSRCEADFRGLSEERNALKLLSGQKVEEIKDLRAELAKAHQDQTDLIGQVMTILKTHGLDSGTVTNISVSQLQQKIERIEQLCEDISTIKAESLGVERSQLRGLKENSSAQAKKIGDLEAQLAFELARAKTKAEKAKAEAEAIMAVYRADAEAAQVQAREPTETVHTRAYWIAELAKCQSRRETLEEIHARYFDLTNEIVKAREHEAEAGVLATFDDDDDDGSKSGSENREDLDREEAAPGRDREP